LAVVGLAVDVAFRHWWRLLLAMVPVLVVARLGYFWLEAATGVAIVNGRLTAKEPSPHLFRFDVTGASAEVHLTASPTLSLGWWLAVLAALPIVNAVATAAPPVPVRVCWRRVVSRLPALAALALLLFAGVFVLASVAGLVASWLGSPLFAAAVAAAGAPLMAPLALAVPAVLVEHRSLATALHRGIEVTRSRWWSIGLALLVGIVIIPGAVLWVARIVERADVSVGGPTTNAVLAGLCGALASAMVLAIVPLQPAMLALTFLWARDRLALDGVEPEAQRADRPMAQPVRLNGAVMMALALAALLPAATETTHVLWNPHHLPVVTEEPFSVANRPIATTARSDGRPAFVFAQDITQCLDAQCSGVRSVSLPCVDGAEMQPMGDGARSCSIEAPLAAATLRPDGTLVGVRHELPNRLRLLHCRVTDEQQCEWGGATTILDAPDEQQFGQVAMADVSSGGVVVAVMRTAKGSDQGEVTLIHCEDLRCAEPRNHRVGRVPAPAGISGGPIALAVEPRTGLVAVGYRDKLNGDLWLGGCSTVECSDASLTRIERSPQPLNHELDGTLFAGAFGDSAEAATLASVFVDATVAGPIALEHINAGWIDVVTCTDPGCAAYHAATIPAMSARLMRDPNGGLVLVAATPGGVTLDPIDAPDSLPVRLPAEDGTEVIAAIMGADGRAHLVLRDAIGSRVVTCTDPSCQ